MKSVINGSGSYAGEDTIQHLVIVDGAVEDISGLMVGIDARQILLLDSQQDGVQQISEILSQYQNLQSVEIISHGNAATLQLGSVDLDSSSLKTYANELQSWGEALTADGDILLWGCGVGAGAATVVVLIIIISICCKKK